MLNFQNDAFKTLVFCNNIRGCRFAESAIYGWVYEGEVVDAVSSIQLENCVQKVCCHFHVFGISENYLENRVVVNIGVLVFFTVFHNALMSVASLLMCFADVFEHCCVLFFIHRTPSPLYSGGNVYAKKRTRFVYCCWLVYFKADNL